MWRGLTFLLPFLFFGHVSHSWVSPSTPWLSTSGSEFQRTLHLLKRPPPPLQFWQLFNALTLFNLARDPECKEWQVSQGSRMHGRFHLDLPVLTPAVPNPCRCSCVASPSFSSSSATSSRPSEWYTRSSTASSTGARRIRVDLMASPKGASDLCARWGSRLGHPCVNGGFPSLPPGLRGLCGP